MLIHIYRNLYIDIHINETHTLYLIRKNPTIYYFSSNHYESYVPFNNDYGPVNIYNILDFCVNTKNRVTNPKLQNRKIVYYIYNNDNSYYMLNTLLLVSAFMIIHYNLKIKDVIFILHTHFNKCPTYFVDCVSQYGGYTTSLIDCIKVIYFMISNNVISLTSFDYNDFMYCLDFNNRDMTVIPKRIIAMVEPQSDKLLEIKEELLRRDVKHIIQLNDDIEYDKSVFTYEMKHYNMSFEDCSTPSIDLVKKFIDVVFTTRDDKIAIHCKAGLGRTGLFVCIYLMLTFKIDTKQAIAMLRMYRSGSIMGFQGHYLEMLESLLIL